MKLDRVTWIDVARGIGIILVIYGHAIGAITMRFIIYSFHMPLFFFLSGMVFKSGKNKPYLPFLIKDFKRIMIPYFIYAFFFFILWLPLTHPERMTIEGISKQVFGIFYGSGNDGYLAFNVVLWFLPCLFLTKQLFWFVSKLLPKQIFLTLICFSIIGYLFSIFFPDVNFPLGFETALTSIVFFGFGYLWKFLPEKVNQTVRKFAWPIFISGILITVVFTLINYHLYGHQIDLRLNHLNNYFLFYAGAFSGILGVIAISMIINKNKVLEYLGQKTMVLFVWHSFVFIYISRILFMTIGQAKVNELKNVFLAPLYTIIAIIVILGFDWLFQYFKTQKNLKFSS